MIGLPGRRNNKWKVYEFRTGVWEMEWEYLLIERTKAWTLNQKLIESFFLIFLVWQWSWMYSVRNHITVFVFLLCSFVIVYLIRKWPYSIPHSNGFNLGALRMTLFGYRRWFLLYQRYKQTKSNPFMFDSLIPN